MRIDDPLDAVAVHAGGGLYGVLLTPFVIRSGVFYSSGDGTTNTLHKIWANVVGALVIIGWSTILSSIMFYTLRLKKWLRVSEEMEKHGLDILKHGEPAYPAQAWLEEQYGYHNQNTENVGFTGYQLLLQGHDRIVLQGGLEIPTDYHHDKITKHLPDATQVVCEQHTCWLPQYKKASTQA